MSIRSLCDKTMTVNSTSRVADDYGGSTKTSTAKYEDIPCAIRRLTGDEATAYGKKSVISTHRVYCEIAYTILETDELVIAGNTYEVLYVYSPRNHHNEIDVRLVQ